MGVYQETGKPPPPNVTPKMARDRAGSDYSGHMSDTTTCSCVASSIDKCSLRGCGMFQEPFFLHPPGSRPRDGIYINPMSAYIGDSPKPKDAAESFYLHSPHDLVYTRITRLFGSDAEKPRNGVAAEQRHVPERKDETLTVKVDVHINNGGFVGRPHPGNGHAARSEIARESSDHAYEQICVRQEETSSVSSSSRKKPADNTSDSRRYSRSSSASESSNMSSEVHGLSSTTSTPSLSRHSSNERIGKSGTKTNAETLHERKDSSGVQVESEKEIRANGNGGPSLSKPPPPPPPPPPDDDVVVVLVNPKPNADAGADKKDARGSGQDGRIESFATNKSDASSSGEHPQQPEVPAPASAPVDADEIKASQASHLVNRHMVLPFIPPKFANADSNTLLKPSEYLKSICKVSAKNSLSKARSVDNLDIQSRNTEQGEEEEEEEEEAEDDEEGARRRTNEETKGSPTGPPPPPLSPLQQRARNQAAGIGTATGTGTGNETESSKNSPMQPLATISIQDLTSIQLRRTSTKMNATKTFSAPPPRSVSMTNVSEPFFVQKTDLIAELKRTKDIPGIKKLKVERAQVEKTQEQNLMSEISKAFNVTNFVDQIPEKDSSGNVIPIWKRQMLARKAAERAKKELEEQIARENEERRQKAIPPWKRQLLAKKDNEEKRLNQTQVSASTSTSTSKFEATSANPKRDVSPATVCVIKKEEKPEVDEKRDDPAKDDSDDGQIIPWRAQLRKTNSKLNILD
ncbi:espin isoform X2 [Solenopsis invicta]|uniref:espin isoform X2 n=1 Tax=Solenopsis invicta TaxID=13686 RepID=UPI00193EA333|nr:espin isoform X2 [Solenopsis invicta]